MTRWKAKFVVILAMLAPLAGWCATGGKNQLIIVSTSELTRYWVVDLLAMPPNLAYFEISGSGRGTGCVNVGFVIEHDGTTSAQRVLKEAFDSGTSRRKDFSIGTFLSMASFSVLQYKAGEENSKQSPVFTSFPFVYMSTQIAKRLNEPQKQDFIRDCGSAAILATFSHGSKSTV